MSITSLRGSTLPNKSFRAGRAKTRDVVTIAPDTATTFANGAAISAGGGGGGGPTISNVSVTDSGYIVSNSTPYIDSTGGFIKITGTGFAAGCTAYVGGNAATSTTFVSATEVRAQVGAAASNAQSVYVVNTDSSVGILLNAITYSGTPSWSTGATLTSQVTDVAFSIPLSATSDSSIVYTVASGSSTPSGTTLFSNGVFAGTVIGINNDTNYSFTVVATDIENQLSARAFTVTVSAGDAYFYLTPLLLNGDGNTWVRDSSVNNAAITVGNDTRPTAFSPYNSNWSVLLPSVSDYLTVPAGTDFAYGTGDFTVDGWVYPTALATFGSVVWSQTTSGTNYFVVSVNTSRSVAFIGTPSGGGTEITGPANSLVTLNAWNHFAITRTSGSVRVYVNGLGGTATSNTTDFTNVSYVPTIGRYTHQGTDVNFTGYISNLRVVKGVAAFTGNFTVPTSLSTVTQSAGSNIAAITTGTVFLGLQNNRFNDANTTPKTITIAGTPQITSFAPFTETDATTGSAYFDGTGDHLIITDNAGMELGAGDFCVECWIYPTSVSGTGVVIDKRSGGYAPLLLWRSSSTLQIYMSLNGSSWGLASAVTVGALVVNQWYHVAIFRVGTSLYTSFNGVVSLVTASGSGTLVNNATNWYIGTETNGSTNPWTGYIADMRFVVGSGIYTSANFTPTTSSLSSVANTQLLTLQYRRGENNHRFIDESGVRALTTRGGNASQGSFSPFSPAGWSGYFDGTGDYLDLTGSSNLAFGTSDWTIELWVYFNSVAGDQIIYDSRPASTNGAYPTIYRSTTTLRYYTNTTEIIASSTITTNTWYHVAVARASGTTRMFINGTVQATTYADSITYLNGASRPRIGDSGVTAGAGFSGYISNLRVVNGTGLYTANFTPATSALTAIANTQLLTLQDNRFKDNSSNNYTITRNGDVKIQAFSPFRPSGSYSPATHGGSAYFDGSGDYVYITNSPAMTLGTNDHCIEFWMYPNGSQNQYTTVWYYSVGSASGATNTYYFSIGSDAGGGVILLGGPLSGTWAVTISLGSTEYTAVLNNWTHVVITRRGSAYRLFLNGILKGYTTYAGSIIAQGGSFSIGWDGANATTYYKGWLSNFRVINGSIPTAYQTSSTTTSTIIFTPPTSVPAFEANTAMAMDFTNGGIVDATARNSFETLGDVKIGNVQSKFGTGALYFDGTGDYLKLQPLPQYTFGTGDFTFECWIYMNSYNATWGAQIFGGHVYGVSADYVWMINTTGKFYFQITSSGAGAITSTSSVPLTTWTHIALVRSSGTVTPYINGTSAGGAAVFTTAMTISTAPTIGADSTGNAGSFLNGYIDDFRISRYARYTSNFTAPTTAFLTK